MLLGPWGRRKMRELVIGRAGSRPTLAQRYFASYIKLIFDNVRPRVIKIPQLDDAALRRLTMPVMAVVGGKDALIDSAETQRRLRANTPGAEVRFLPDARHLLPSQTGEVFAFLSRALGEGAA